MSPPGAQEKLYRLRVCVTRALPSWGSAKYKLYSPQYSETRADPSRGSAQYKLYSPQYSETRADPSRGSAEYRLYSSQYKLSCSQESFSCEPPAPARSRASRPYAPGTTNRTFFSQEPALDCRAEEDARRDTNLRVLGARVLRVSAPAIRERMEVVLRQITDPCVVSRRTRRAEG